MHLKLIAGAAVGVENGRLQIGDGERPLGGQLRRQVAEPGQILQQTGRLQLSGVDLSNLTQLLALPQTDQICARLLSGDANADGQLDDVNGRVSGSS